MTARSIETLDAGRTGIANGIPAGHSLHQMSGRQSDAHYRDLERRLSDLRPLAEIVLAADAYKWFVEFVDAGEYGLAVEVAAEALPAARTGPTEALRCGLTGLADAMGIGLPASANQPGT